MAAESNPTLAQAVDMRNPAFRDDPHPLLRALREQGRVSRDVLGIWLVCGHADSSAGLRNSHLSREPWRMPVYAKLDELLGNLILLFIAGHETTTNLIGNGMLTLLRHPHELQRLRAQPELMPGAIDEMLRFEGSVTTVSRHTIEPYAIGEHVIPAGETLFFMLGAANRDPATFADAQRFDIARSPNPHLGFGAGIHYCLGAPLARLEAEVAFIKLLQRYPRLELVDAQPQWRKLINLRGLEALRLKPTAP